MGVAKPPAGGGTGFSEREFYRNEFRGRTLAIATERLAGPDPLGAALDELGTGGARAIVVSRDANELAKLVEGRVLPGTGERLEGAVWRALRAEPRVGITVAPEAPFAAGCRDLALRLGLFKLVWIDPQGGLVDPSGARHSFVDRAELRGWIDGAAPEFRARPELCHQVDAMLALGVPQVNVCTLAGLSDELFTYAGSGTLFTRERYIAVRPLSIDDYDAAFDLLQRGVEEEYLMPRPEEELDRVLANGFGAFVAGRHLAGIGALLVQETSRTAEVSSLYTVTRFLGEGVGKHLVAHALGRARELGLESVFACTTSERVAAFFERQGFERIEPERLPPEKWRGYAPERRARILCLRLALS